MKTTLSASAPIREIRGQKETSSALIGVASGSNFFSSALRRKVNQLPSERGWSRMGGWFVRRAGE